MIRNGVVLRRTATVARATSKTVPYVLTDGGGWRRRGEEKN